MPTIDQLAPAAAASDADTLMVSQNGVSRKISRAQFLAGLQPQLATSPGTLLGNPGPTSSSPASISVGANLTLRGGTLSATAMPYSVASMPQGIVPAPTDSVPLGQAGANVAVSYAQFMSGLSSVENVDISKFVLAPTGSQLHVKLGDFAAAAVTTTGATMTGSLTLAGDPAAPLQAATRRYVDSASSSMLPRSGGVLTGPLTLAGPPTQPFHAATRAYVDGQAASYLQKSGGTVAGPLTLAGDPVQPLDAATRRYVDAGDAAALSAIATEAAARATSEAAVQTAANSAHALAVAAQASAATAQAAAVTSQANASAAQTSATSALATVTTAQSLASAALPSTGGNMVGNLTLSSSYVYAGSDDFAAVRAQGRPTDGKAMLYVNKIGSSGNDPSLLSSYYYVNDTGGSSTPRLVNNLQANVVSTPISGIWLSHLGITSSAVGGNQGLNGHLAVDMQAIRDVATPLGNTTVQTALTAPAASLAVASLANFNQAPVTGGPSAGTLASLVNAVPLSTVTTTATAPGGLNATLQIASTAGILPGMFCWGTNVSGYVVSTATTAVKLANGLSTTLPSGAPLSFGWCLLVKVGGRFYHLVSVSASTGAGSMTFGEPVAISDGASGNSVTVAQGGAPLWSFVAEIQDHTNLSSSAGGFAQIGEMDISGNGDDDGAGALIYSPTTGYNIPQGGRCFLSFVGSKFNATGPDFVVGTGLGFTTGIGASINSLLLANVTFNSAILDARRAVASSASANAVWLADGQRFSLSTDGKVGLWYDPNSAVLNVSGAARLSAPLLLASFSVGTLPSSPVPGSKVYAANGRKPGEPGGGGTGVEVFADSTGRWISVLSGSQVQS